MAEQAKLQQKFEKSKENIKTIHKKQVQDL